MAFGVLLGGHLGTWDRYRVSASAALWNRSDRCLPILVIACVEQGLTQEILYMSGPQLPATAPVPGSSAMGQSISSSAGLAGGRPP